MGHHSFGRDCLFEAVVLVPIVIAKSNLVIGIVTEKQNNISIGNRMGTSKIKD